MTDSMGDGGQDSQKNSGGDAPAAGVPAVSGNGLAAHSAAGSAAKSPRLVGSFVRQKRETRSLSQRALGQLFQPPVTTQFISNVERGVTPLPPAHVPTLAKALQVPEAELMALLEREYTIKLSGRVGRVNGHAGGPESGNGEYLDPALGPGAFPLVIQMKDQEFMQGLYQAYRHADEKAQEAFRKVAKSLLGL